MNKSEDKIKLTLKNKLLLLFIFLHLSIIISVCISNTINAYHIVYYSNEKRPPLQSLRNHILNGLTLPVIVQYSYAAGIDASYGFFAPSVASGYILKFSANDINKKKHSIYLPSFKSKEGLIRYNTLLGAFQERFKELSKEGKTNNKNNIKKTLYARYLDVIIKTIGRSIQKDYSDKLDKKMVASLYLYDFPTLKTYLTGSQSPSLVHLMDLEIKRK